MISETALDQAVARNVLTPAQAEELRALARAEAAAYVPAPPPLPRRHPSRCSQMRTRSTMKSCASSPASPIFS